MAEQAAQAARCVIMIYAKVFALIIRPAIRACCFARVGSFADGASIILSFKDGAILLYRDPESFF
jgi:hypothetical protein